MTPAGPKPRYIRGLKICTQPNMQIDLLQRADEKSKEHLNILMDTLVFPDLKIKHKMKENLSRKNKVERNYKNNLHIN